MLDKLELKNIINNLSLCLILYTVEGGKYRMNIKNINSLKNKKVI